MDNLTRNPTGLVAGEEGDETGRVFRLPHALLWVLLDQLLSQFIGHPTGICRAGVNGIDRNAVMRIDRRQVRQ